MKLGLGNQIGALVWLLLLAYLERKTGEEERQGGTQGQGE